MAESMRERVARAMESVPHHFARLNDFSDADPDHPLEVCRYGGPGESEIVVVKRYPARYGAAVALGEVLRLLRADAALSAMEEATPGMIDAGVMTDTPDVNVTVIWRAMVKAARE